ncbi:DUF1289 domain-containing protein [Sphingosinicella sp. LHD-64]|uniref:DUF1289 domain-containing protein n=1 Tax=Sphingosinicella sp. LHD-64 TaxID=3072139 RepID=UPI0028102F05|nr:DUF1289 domain-containing protein [Sphingosinicella sp. LHD-64]MDQ8755928.1 DUF1289 domain-containing protein [Sphingosinicella sp. LHD-64]
MSKEAVPSPCILVCTLDPGTDTCTGCGRTLDEIAEWASAPRARQLEIVADAAARLAAIHADQAPLPGREGPRVGCERSEPSETG